MKKVIILGSGGLFPGSTIIGFYDFNAIFKKCKYASCWFGDDAEIRIMNILSPKMSQETFEDRFDKSKKRDVNCFHLILANKGDGPKEEVGYSIYGESFSMNKVDTDSIDTFKTRISFLKYKKKNDYKDCGIVLWLVTDESTDYAKAIKQNYEQYIEDLDKNGILKLADIICVGLEVDEYWNADTVKDIITKVKKHFKGPVGVHTTSIDKAKTFGSLGDIYFAQISPTKDSSTIENAVKNAKNDSGKPVNFFEFQRYPDNDGCEVALKAGAVGVGNW